MAAPAPHKLFSQAAVLFTDRFGAEDELSTAVAYNSTGLVWVYSTSSAFVNASHAMGFTVNLAINSETPDSTATPPTYNIGRVLDVHGNKVTAPWMASWTPVPYWGCANNPAYQAIALARYKLLVDAGADSIQHDDAGMNADATAYGGCFCSYCVAGFSAYLNQTLTPQQLAKFGINDTATFSYKQYVLQHGSNTGLQPYFQQYQVDSVVNHYRTVHAQVDAYAGHQLVYSSNNAGRWTPPYNMFGVGLAELYPSDVCPHAPNASCGPKEIVPLYVEPALRGQQQVFTMPKRDGSFHNCNASEWMSSVVLTRRLAALAYAVGGVSIVPYNIFMPDGCPRYFGNVSTYGDIFRFVRTRQSLLDGYTNATAFSSDGDGAGDAATASQGDVFVYVRQPETTGMAASGSGQAARMDFAVHVVDFREPAGAAAFDMSSASPVNVTLALGWFATRLASCPPADVATEITVYSTRAHPDGRPGPPIPTGADSVAVPLQSDELSPWVLLGVTLTCGPTAAR